MLCFFKQKTAYEMRISDWSSDVCSSDLIGLEKDGDVVIRVLPSVAPRPRAEQDKSLKALAVKMPHRLLQAGQYTIVHELSPCKPTDRKSVVEGKSVSVRVGLGGRRFIKKKNILTTI